MEMQCLKPSVLMGKLKQHLPPGVSPDNDLFLSMFLIRHPTSMREAVGAGTHKTAAAMVNAADALWDARGGHDPTVAAAATQSSRSPAPNSGNGVVTNGVVTPAPKVVTLLALTSIPSKTLAMVCVNFTITTPIRHLVLGWKTFLLIIYSHKEKKRKHADTNLQERRQEKNMANWL